MGFGGLGQGRGKPFVQHGISAGDGGDGACAPVVQAVAHLGHAGTGQGGKVMVGGINQGADGSSGSDCGGYSGGFGRTVQQGGGVLRVKEGADAVTLMRCGRKLASVIQSHGSRIAGAARAVLAKGQVEIGHLLA